MSTALIPARLIPVARTDADWALDITFPEENWTGAVVKVAFARQGLPAVRFEIDAEVPAPDLACAIRLKHEFLSDKTPGVYTAEVRRFQNGEVDDAAVFEMKLVQGVSDVSMIQIAPLPIGDSEATGSAVITRKTRIEVIRAGGTRGMSAKDVLIAAGDLPEGADDEAFRDYLREPAQQAGEQASEAADEARQAATAANDAAQAGQQLVADEAEIRAQVIAWAQTAVAAADRAEEARDDAGGSRDESVAARDEAIEARDAGLSAQGYAEAARDEAVNAAGSFDQLLTTAQRAQTIYGLNDFASAFLFAKQGIELLFVPNYYRNGLVVK